MAADAVRVGLLKAGLEREQWEIEAPVAWDPASARKEVYWGIEQLREAFGDRTPPQNTAQRGRNHLNN